MGLVTIPAIPTHSKTLNHVLSATRCVVDSAPVQATSCKITPAAATVFPLDRAGEALALLRDRRIDGRAVLRLRDD